MTVVRFEEKTYNTDSFDFTLWKRIFGLLAKQKKRLYALGVLNMFIALFDVALPYMNKIAIDEFATGNGSDENLKLFAIVFVIGALVQGSSLYVYFMQVGKLELQTSYEIRKELFNKIQSFSYSYFDVTPAGWLLSRLTSDVARLSSILSWYLLDIFWGLCQMIAITVVMFTVNVKLALMVLLVVPAITFVARYFNIRILKNYREVRRINSKITNGFNEGISGAKTTKTLVLEDANLKEFSMDTHEMHKVSVHATSLSSIFYPIIMALSSFSLALILVYGGHQVLLTTLEFGTLMMFTEYARQFFDPLNTLASIFAELQMAQASAERILSLYDEEPRIVDSKEVIEKYGTELEPKIDNYEALHGDITFDHVGFYYKEGQPILEDFNLSVKEGETVALVGETGSGKSTIINLLCRFYEPTSGKILIDGRDYKERSIGWLHYNLGYVLQSPHLFSGTIKENIRFGRLDATDEEIIEAAKMVDADKFINAFENGYDTDVGEGGDRLSTGQKQLISFARAIIANPRIFILDEATSSVDTETEQVINKTIDKVRKGKTTFIVAHRLSTIVNADKILVIRKGIIEEQGTHQELLEKKGYYCRLYTNQFKEDEEKALMGERKEKEEDDALFDHYSDDLD